MQNILDIALEHAKREGDTQIHRMTLRIGKDCGCGQVGAVAIDGVTRHEHSHLHAHSHPDDRRHEHQHPYPDFTGNGAVSARTGQGMEAWYSYLASTIP